MLGIFKNWQHFSRKIHFCQNLEKQGPKWPQNRFFLEFFKKVLSLVFPGNNLISDRNLILLYWYFTWNPISGKFRFSTYGSKYCWTIKLQDSLKCSIPKKKWMINCSFVMQINLKVFYKFVPSYWVCMPGMPKLPKMRSLHIIAISLGKHGEWSWFFLPVDSMKAFYKLIGSLWVCLARYDKSTQSNKFVISLQYLKGNLKDEVGFLQADKRERFLQISSN